MTSFVENIGSLLGPSAEDYRYLVPRAFDALLRRVGDTTEPQDYGFRIEYLSRSYAPPPTGMFAPQILALETDLPRVKFRQKCKKIRHAETLARLAWTRSPDTNPLYDMQFILRRVQMELSNGYVMAWTGCELVHMEKRLHMDRHGHHMAMTLDDEDKQDRLRRIWSHIWDELVNIHMDACHAQIAKLESKNYAF